MPVTVIVPRPVVAGAVYGFVLVPPLLSVTFTVSVLCDVASRPTETLTAGAVVAFTALLEPWGLASAMLVGGAGAAVSFVTVAGVGSDLPNEVSAETVTVSGPSIRAWPLRPGQVKCRIPDADVPKSRAVWSWSGLPSLTVRSILSVGTDVSGSETSKLSELRLPVLM